MMVKSVVGRNLVAIMTEYRTDHEKVLLELTLQDFDVVGLTKEQIEIVGIEPANLDVTELLSGTGMSDARLEIIERYLAAHNLMTTNIGELRQMRSEGRSDSSSSAYVTPSSVSSGLDETTAGRKALNADTSKTLQGLNKQTPYLRAIDDKGELG